MKVVRVKTPARVIVAALRKSVSSLPLRLWIFTRAVPRLQGIQEWPTPFASVRDLLAGQIGAQQWAQVAITVLVRVVTLNAAGVLRVYRVAKSGTVGAVTEP
jgi:hypothetical protein